MKFAVDRESKKVGNLPPGSEIWALAVQGNRVQCTQGWCSILSSKGDTLLEEGAEPMDSDDSSDQEEQEQEQQQQQQQEQQQQQQEQDQAERARNSVCLAQQLFLKNQECEALRCKATQLAVEASELPSASLS